MLGNGDEVLRLETLDEQRFKSEFEAKNQPVLVTGDPRLNEASRRWSFEYLVEKHPNCEVECEYYPLGDRNTDWKTVSLLLTDYLAKTRDPQTEKQYYLAERPFRRTFPNVVDELPAPPFLASRQTRPVVFVGKNCYTSAHYHPAPLEAVLMEITGQKRVVLCPGRHYRAFAPYAWYTNKPNWSTWSFNTDSLDERQERGAPSPFWLADDAERFREMAGEHVRECVVEAGQCLYIPQGWFHLVYGVGECISVTHFFDGRWRHAYPRLIARDVITRLQQRIVMRGIDAFAKKLKVEGVVRRVGTALGLDKRVN